MNKDDIIRMAREAGLPLEWISESGVLTWSELKRFAALVAAQEREACAITCEQTTASWTQHLYNEGVMDCVKAIRARGEK